MAGYCDRIINYFIHSSASRNTLLIIWKCLLRIRYSFWRICCFNYCCWTYENCRFILGGFYQVTIFVENIPILVNINTINFNINFNIVYHRNILLPPSFLRILIYELVNSNNNNNNKKKRYVFTKILKIIKKDQKLPVHVTISTTIKIYRNLKKKERDQSSLIEKQKPNITLPFEFKFFPPLVLSSFPFCCQQFQIEIRADWNWTPGKTQNLTRI